MMVIVWENGNLKHQDKQDSSQGILQDYRRSAMSARSHCHLIRAHFRNGTDLARLLRLLSSTSRTPLLFPPLKTYLLQNHSIR
jgi:hypothetical protein